MATKREPRFKLCRRFGVNIFGHPKAMKRAEGMPRKKKMSNYSIQLNEKQKLKAYYGIFEKQMRRYMSRASKGTGLTGTALLTSLECRLDNMVYRIGFANSIRMARQIVSHGHILVNGKRVNIPSYRVSIEDVITLREKSRTVKSYTDNFLELKSFNLPYIEKDFEGFSGKLVRLPMREEIPIEVDDMLVIEFYSR